MTHRMKRSFWLFIFFLAVSRIEAGELDATKFIDRALPDCGIQKAIDSLGKQGGEVVLPAGRFELLRSIMLPSNVALRGQGPDKTILAGKRSNAWFPIVSFENNRVTVESLPPGLHVGSSIYLFPERPLKGWGGYYVPQVVTALDGKILTIDGVQLRSGKSKYVEFGLCSALTEDCLKGTTELKVADGSMFVPGQAISVGSADGNNNESLSFIKAIKDNTLILERAIRMDHKAATNGYWKRPAVWSLFPLVTAESATNIAIHSIGFDSPIKPDERPLLSRYTTSLIHLYGCKDSVLENLRIQNSPADGISIQGGDRVTISDCVVRGCQGNGFHPGTDLGESVFENNLSENNGVGLYFCWHNHRLVLRNNKFIHNRGGGITGLGNPGDVNNVIEQNLIANNGGPGIEINGGKKSGNIIRNNTIENNSQDKPGKFPGIAVYAATEDALDYTIVDNTIRDTQSTPTQQIGIEERNGEYQKKPTRADENVIRNNKFQGQTVADIVVAGAATKVDNADAKVLKATELAAITKSSK